MRCAHGLELLLRQKPYLTNTPTNAKVQSSFAPHTLIIRLCTNDHEPFLDLGYGFVDFESPIAAENAVAELQKQGIQAQMAKVCVMFVDV